MAGWFRETLQTLQSCMYKSLGCCLQSFSLQHEGFKEEAGVSQKHLGGERG